jgi:carbamoyl-phosphate synthase large subunit
MSQPFTVMLSAAGRRVALLQILCDSVAQAGFVPRIVSTDVTRMSAAFHLGDISRLVPRYREPGCLDFLVDLCAELQVKLLVPTIDPELPFYAEHRQRFADAGTTVLISSPQSIRICNDKRTTHQWLVEHNLPTVRQADVSAVVQTPRDWKFPSFVKPSGGSASIGARVVRDLDDLRSATAGGDYIVQEIAPGREYTVDLFIDRSGRCRCAVPRMRIETRGGEVSKGVTARCQPVQDLARRVAESLPGAWGVINTQIFYDDASRALNVIEINPRFGGGYPLSHQAGATMARWVVEDVAGLPSTARDDLWTDGLVMLRYDQAVFIPAAEAQDTPGPLWPKPPR